VEVGVVAASAHQPLPGVVRSALPIGGWLKWSKTIRRCGCFFGDLQGRPDYGREELHEIIGYVEHGHSPRLSSTCPGAAIPGGLGCDQVTDALEVAVGTILPVDDLRRDDGVLSGSQPTTR